MYSRFTHNICLTAGEYSTSTLKSTLSAPIFMDNVACQGSEAKLIDCTYHTDTSEDKHSDDIWVKCSIQSASSSQDNAISDAALAVAVIGLMISIFVITFMIGCVLYSHKNKKHTNER